MSLKLEATAEILINEGIAIAGSTLYIYNMPENVQSGLVLLDDPDTPTEIDEYIPKLKKSNFRVVVRGGDYESALSKTTEVLGVLDKHNYVALNGLKFLRIKPAYDPIAYPLADSDLVEVSINLWAAYIEP